MSQEIQEGSIIIRRDVLTEWAMVVLYFPFSLFFVQWKFPDVVILSVA